MGQDFISQNISSSYNNDVNYGNITGTLRYNHIFNERLFSNTSVIYSKYKMWVNQHPDTFSYKDQMGLEHYEFKSEFTYSPFKHKLNFGIQSIYYTFHPGDQIPEVNDSAYINKIDLEAEHAIESAVFIEDQYSLTPSLDIQFGLRLSDYNYLGAANIYKYLPNEPRDIRNITDTIHYGNNKIIQNYNNIEPRLALKYKINENQVATLTYNKMAQYVQLVSRTFDPLPYNMWKPGDNYLKPLIGNQFSAGWFVQFPDRNIDFSIESYYKFLDNLLEVKPGADIFLNKALDASLLQGIGRAYGIELALNKTEGKFTGMVSYTWSRTEIKVDSKFMEDKINFGKYYPTDYDVPNKFTSAGVYRIGKRLSFTANFFYQTGRPLTLPSGEFIYYNQLMPYYSGKNLDRYPSYNRLDLGAILYNRQKPGRKWQGCWMLSVYNVYSRENDYAIIIQEKANSRDTQAVKEWIFNVVPSLSYSFKF